MQTDEELIAAINAGDYEAFESLYYRYRDWVYNLAFRLTGNRELALDVLQETYLYFLKKFPGFRLTCGMKTFLYPVVKHVSINMAKKVRKGFSGDYFTEEPVAAAETNRADQRRELAIVLKKLPSEQGEVVLMRFLDDMGLGEIAEVMKAPVSTVKSRLYRALEVLRADENCRKYFEER